MFRSWNRSTTSLRGRWMWLSVWMSLNISRNHNTSLQCFATGCVLTVSCLCMHHTAMIHPARGTHLLENRRYSGDWKQVYGSCGFVPIDSNVFWDPIAFQKKDSPNTISATLSSKLRFMTGQALLSIGRWPCPVHIWIARQIAKAPKEWVNQLRGIVGRYSKEVAVDGNTMTLRPVSKRTTDSAIKPSRTSLPRHSSRSRDRFRLAQVGS